MRATEGRGVFLLFGGCPTYTDVAGAIHQHCQNGTVAPYIGDSPPIDLRHRWRRRLPAARPSLRNAANYLTFAPTRRFTA